MKKTIHITLLILATLTLVFGVAWLAIILLIINGIYFLANSKLKFIRYIKSHKWLSWSISVLTVFTVAIFIRLFVIEIYQIPSGSMEDTLLVGDKIMVNKLQYGPVPPQSPYEIPWVNLFFYFNKDARAKQHEVWWNTSRIGGFSNIERGDVMVFRIYKKKKNFLIKRCVGLPGDEIKIIDGKLLVNDKTPRLESIPKIKQKQIIYLNNTDDFKLYAENMGDEMYVYSTHKTVKTIMTREQLSKLENQSFVDSIRVDVQQPDGTIHAYPRVKDIDWTFDFWGKMKTPYKGMKITLNKENVKLYAHLLKVQEGMKHKVVDGYIFVDGVRLDNYTFKKDYYFMMGDNRNNSRDSRWWGFIPKERIEGQATRVLWSFYQGEMKWKRIMKRIE